jgi:hypothetical protein
VLSPPSQAIDVWTGTCVLFAFLPLLQAVACLAPSGQAEDGPPRTCCDRVERVSRVLGPAAFTPFCIAYFCYYCA